MANEKLKAARKAKGFTQQFMASQLGYSSKSGYNMIERGKNKPPLTTAMKIAALLDSDVNSLFDDIQVHESRTQQAATSA